MIRSRSGLSAAPVGYRFPREVIAVAVRWYLRYGLSYRDVEELLTERGIEVDHVTVYWWVQTFTPEFIDAARPARHAAGGRWFVDETYVEVGGRWTYLYARLISTARSSTYCFQLSDTVPQHAGSSPARCDAIRTGPGGGRERPGAGLPASGG